MHPKRPNESEYRIQRYPRPSREMGVSRQIASTCAWYDTLHYGLQDRVLVPSYLERDDTLRVAKDRVG